MRQFERLVFAVTLLPTMVVPLLCSAEVTDLPGYGRPPAPQYSGFLDAGAVEPEPAESKLLEF